MIFYLSSFFLRLFPVSTAGPTPAYLGLAGAFHSGPGIFGLCLEFEDDLERRRRLP